MNRGRKPGLVALWRSDCLLAPTKAQCPRSHYLLLSKKWGENLLDNGIGRHLRGRCSGKRIGESEIPKSFGRPGASQTWEDTSNRCGKRSSAGEPIPSIDDTIVQLFIFQASVLITRVERIQSECSEPSIGHRSLARSAYRNERNPPDWDPSPLYFVRRGIRVTSRVPRVEQASQYEPRLYETSSTATNFFLLRHRIAWEANHCKDTRDEQIRFQKWISDS